VSTIGTQKTALIGHPADIDLFKSYVSFLKPGKIYRDDLLIKLFEWTPAYMVKEYPCLSFDGIAHINAAFFIVPFLPEMRDIKLKRVIEKIDQVLGLAKEKGCTIAAMGGFTSIVLQGQEKKLADKYGIKITSGNTLTAAIIIKSIEIISEKFGVDLSSSSMAIIGASGDIGSACLGYFSTHVKRIYLTARSLPTLAEVIARHTDYATAELLLTEDNRKAISSSNICIFVTSAYTHLFTDADFTPGVIVCDASAPLNVKVGNPRRPDVFVYHGGIVSIPFPIHTGFDVGLASEYSFYACQLEGLLLGLNPELPCSWGRGNITREKLSLFLNALSKYPLLTPAFTVGNTWYSNEELAQYADAWRKNCHQT
jgi:fatty aldehyde-generating acyl-ACP reductase